MSCVGQMPQEMAGSAGSDNLINCYGNVKACRKTHICELIAARCRSHSILANSCGSGFLAVVAIGDYGKVGPAGHDQHTLEHTTSNPLLVK